MTLMKGGTLEVVLVGAQGIKHTNLTGIPVYNALLECGDKLYHSKRSSGKHGEVYWNQKFRFEFSSVEMRHLMHLKIRLMNSRKLRASEFVGQTIVHIGGIIEEGTTRGMVEVKPTAYNVVLDDDTYRGEIKLGMKFTVTTEANGWESKSSTSDDEEEHQSLWSIIRKLVLRFLPNKTVCQNKAGQI
uniref:C2 domain-containing protein n=1 Tax=Kalanchoe fedtschenkoi TaxID=63787 RepID=A0A7N0SZC3_KALFE